MCHFPTDIKYKNEIPPFPDGNGRLVGTAKSMYRRLKDLNIVDERFLDGVGDINDLERNIFSLIDGYPDNKASLERIFHMIEIWGGKEGYQFYYKQQFDICSMDIFDKNLSKNILLNFRYMYRKKNNHKIQNFQRYQLDQMEFLLNLAYFFRLYIFHKRPNICLFYLAAFYIFYIFFEIIFRQI